MSRRTDVAYAAYRNLVTMSIKIYETLSSLAASRIIERDDLGRIMSEYRIRCDKRGACEKGARASAGRLRRNSISENSIRESDFTPRRATRRIITARVAS